MAKIQITLTQEPTALIVYHKAYTGLTVYAYNPDLNSGVDQLLTESGVSGVYKNASVDAGSYQVWIGGDHTAGVRYKEYEPLIAEEISAAGIKDDAVVEDKLLDGSVTEGKIGALAVTEGKIGALAVTEGKIGAGAVTEVKLGALAVTEGKIGALAVTEGKIGALAVTEGKIGADAVSGSKIADDSIDSEHIVDGAVDFIHIAALAYSAAASGSKLVQYNADGDIAATDILASGKMELDRTAKIQMKSQYVIVDSGISGASNIDIDFDDLAIGDKIEAVLIRVDVALGQTWSAKYNAGGNQQVIAIAGQASAANTKVSKFFDAFTESAIVKSSPLYAVITADSGTFSAGQVTAVIFYWHLVDLPDYSPAE